MAEADSRDREEIEVLTNAALEARDEQINDLRQQSFAFAGGNDWSCKRCGDIFSSMRLLGFHRCDFTRQIDQTETEAEVYNFRHLPAPSENDWKCQRCGEVFSSMTSISTHTCDFTQNVNQNETGTGNVQAGEAEEEKEKWETEYNVDVPDLDGNGSDPEAVDAANPDTNLTTSTPDRADRDTTQFQNENIQSSPRRIRLLQKQIKLSQAWKDNKEK